MPAAWFFLFLTSQISPVFTCSRKPKMNIMNTYEHYLILKISILIFFKRPKKGFFTK